MFTGSIFLNLQKVLLCMAPNLDDGLGANKSLYLLPVTVKELQGLEELVVLLLRPALPGLGDGVRLPHLLARVLPRPGRIRLRRRRRAGGDHREASGEGSQRCGDGMAASCRPLARVEVEEVCCPVCEQLQRGCGPRGGRAWHWVGGGAGAGQ